MSHRRRRVPPWSTVLVVALVVAAAAVGCGRPPAPATPPSGTAPSAAVPSAALADRLLLLTGRPGAVTLELVDGSGARAALPLPDADVAWVSTDRTGRALVTTRHGRAYRSAPIEPTGGDPAWRRVMPTGIEATLPAPLAFGTLDAGGSRAAFVAADFGSNGPFQVVVVAIPGGAARAIPVHRPAEGAPPAWIGDRLAVLTRERGDAPGVTLVDPATGALTDGPGPAGGSWPPGQVAWTGRIAGLSVSADGTTIAVAQRADGPIEIRPAADWLSGRPPVAEQIDLEPDPTGSTSFAWLAASPDGRRLAVVRADEDGDAAAVEVYAAIAGWGRTARISLPLGALRATVAWLP